MKNDDVALIRQILAGDETAFAELVKKYQKQVHVLAWRKIGDFHIAEDITQDAFLKVYQRLHTLKNPNQFSGWLYVITTNLCATWLRKNRIQTQPLEDTEITMGQRDAYSQHVVEERANTAVETQREVVKRLLAKLKESERTVMALHYLGEMTVEEISKFLGVSTGTIKSRLQRARNRLQKEETMIREALDHFQISPNLTDNIMQEVARLKPAAPSGSKPLMPWIAAASSVVLIVFMLGLGSQYLARFQKPYSLDAQAETTVELVDAPIVLNVDAKPDVQRQLGNSEALGNDDSNRQKPDEILLASAQTEGKDTVAQKQEWIKGNIPEMGIYMGDLFLTPDEEIYLVHPSKYIYKLLVDISELQLVKDVSKLATGWDDEIPLAKLNDKLYVVINDELLSSTDGGKTLQSVGKCPEGNVRDLVITDGAFYLVHDDSIFSSTNSGKTWTPVRLSGRFHSLDVVQDTLFASTDTGLYRFNAGNLERLQFPVDEAEFFTSFAGTEDNLYVKAELHFEKNDWKKQSWWIFRSTDNGDSWTDITPTNAWHFMGDPPAVELAAAGKTVLVIGKNDGFVARSIDNGNTWTLVENTGIPISSSGISQIVAINESTYFSSGNSGILYSIDGGLSWERFNVGMESRIDNLISIRNNNGQNPSGTFYALILSDIYKSRDNGKSWRVINPKRQITKFNPNQEAPPQFTQIGESDGILYAKFGGRSLRDEEAGIYRISTDGANFIPIQGMPHLSSQKIKILVSQRFQGHLNMSDKSFFEKLKKNGLGSDQFFKQLAEGEIQKQDAEIQRQLYTEQTQLINSGLGGQFAVSGNTFYMVYNFKLFRWKPGDTEWYDTGVEETAELTYKKVIEALEQEGLPKEKIGEILTSWLRGFKLAVLGDTVYVGKRDGQLVVSFDRGDNWIDITYNLPFKVKALKDIVFAGSTVYVATDEGVVKSSDGKRWQAVTNSDGTPINMNKLAVDGTTLYGVSKRTGVYRLENGTWKQIVSDVPIRVNSLVVDGNTLYVGTKYEGMFHFNLEE
ncbi:hypothetical protein C6501_05530 [Candidatus Poribacteria bacterium]|nr:MAG: hypothetical protein C6501_05530 [Candidatus Poribacteria bacterium]